MNHRFIFIFKVLLILIVGYLASYILNIGIGGDGKFRHVILILFLLLFSTSSKKIFWYIVFPFICLHALYVPIGITFGKMSYDFLIAGLSTDLVEASEFTSQIKIIGYVYAVLLILITILFKYLTKYFDVNFLRNKTFVFIAVVVMLSSQAPGDLFRQFKYSLRQWNKELESLKSLTTESKWEKVSLNEDSYDIYLLIIGESARKDYHHAYGYPINNTAFMSTSNGILIDGLTSGGTSTVPSLKNMLTFSPDKNWDANYSYDFISLAEKAGLNTYWLSNQGYLGVYDTPISALAQSSSESFFTKFGEYNSGNTSDFILVEKLKDILQKDESEKKLIVMHLYGSHPDACDRVSDYNLLVNADKYHSYVNCYISSIQKTDDILKQSYDLLNEMYIEKNKTYSLIYFSDHGLSHNENNEEIQLNNAKLSNHHYDVPLFKVSSDDSNRLTCKSFKSGLNFTNGLANWMKIKTPILNEKYDLFDCQDDPNDFGLLEKIRLINNDDPALYQLNSSISN